MTEHIPIESDAQRQSVRVVIEVHAGVIPGRPEQEHSRRWAITSREWYDSDNQYALLAERNSLATSYGQSLMMQPDRLNWVRVDWVWL
jgi:hypothetical protein